MLLGTFDRKKSVKNRGRCLFFSRKCSRKSFGVALRNLKAQIGMKITESRLPTPGNFSYKMKNLACVITWRRASTIQITFFQLVPKKRAKKARPKNEIMFLSIFAECVTLCV